MQDMKEKRKRGVFATKEGIEKLKKAKANHRNDSGKPWAYADIAFASGLDEKTVGRFLNQKQPVDESSAISICKSLNLDAMEVIDFEKSNKEQLDNKNSVFSITGSFEKNQITEAKIKALLASLREISGDASLQIVDISEGSIRLILEGSPEGIERLEQLFKSGELTEVLNLPVENVSFVNTGTSKNNKKRLALTIAGHATQGDIENLKAALINNSNQENTVTMSSYLTNQKDIPRDLINQNFSRQDLRGKDFFSGANLRGANFSGANLEKVDFSDAQLQGANFQGANLREANFTHTSVDYDDDSVPKVNFSYADIQGTNFTDAQLKGANFTGAKAGLSRSWNFFVIISSIILCLCSAFPTAIISTFSIYFFRSSPKKPSIIVSLIVGILSVVLTIAIRIFLLVLKDNSSFVAMHVSVGIIMMLMVLFGRIIAIITTDNDEEEDFGYVFWSTIISIVILVCTIIFKGILEDFETVIVNYIGIKQSGFGIFGAIIGAFFGCWFARTAISEKNRFKWLWNIYIRFVTRGGTLFKDSDLTNTTFNLAMLRGANFKNTKLKRIIWNGVKSLEYARVTNSYLKHSKIKKLILGRRLRDEEKEFNGLNLEGINLEGKNLCKANFTGTNLNQGNLRNANLKQANLEQAKLNGADLTGACLTGAILHDWSIDDNTKLTQVECEYIYQEKLPDKNAGYRRFPPSPKKFKAGDFEKFFRKDKETIQLLIRNDYNKQALKSAIEQLKQVTDSKFQGLEKVGEDFLIKIKIPKDKDIDTSTVEDTFYNSYETEEKNLKSKPGSKNYENLSWSEFFEVLLKVLERPINITNNNNNNNINGSSDITNNVAQDNSQTENNQKKAEQ